MATYIVDSTGSNNAELIGDFTTSDVAQTVTFNAGTDGEAKPLKALETTRQWLVIEVRDIDGVAGVIGKHVYSEDVTDIQTRVEAIRNDMVSLHSFFNIMCTHYKTGDVCDVYRGDKLSSVSLVPGDTNITFTPPNVWVIDDLTPFAPTTPAVETNIVIDSGCDNPSEWGNMGGFTISGSKLHANGATGGRCFPNLSEALIAGATYRLEVDMESRTVGYFRFYCGNIASSEGFQTAIGHHTSEIVCPASPLDISIQGSGDCDGVFDNFTCTRV